MSQESQQSMKIMSQETLKHIFESLETSCYEDVENENFTKIIDHHLYEKDDTCSFGMGDFKYQLNIERIRPLPQLHQDVAVHTSQSAAVILPSSAEYPGPYNFQFEFGEQPKDTKSAAWNYSSILKKLYAQKDAMCPVRFCISEKQQMCSSNLFIRALPIFGRQEHMQEVVKRCPNHVQAPESADIAHREHFVWCDSRSVRYQHDAHGRYSVLVPLDRPPAGTPWVTYVYSFKCRNSCIGGPNRREVMLVFILENSDGEVVGRRSLDLRICACPGRDRRADESKANTSPKASRVSPADQQSGTRQDSPPHQQPGMSRDSPPRQLHHVSRISSMPVLDSGAGDKEAVTLRCASPSRNSEACIQPSNPALPVKGRVLEMETYQVTKKARADNELFALYVRSREHFELLTKIRDSLELADSLPVTTRHQHLQWRKPPDGPVSQTAQVPANGELSSQVHYSSLFTSSSADTTVGADLLNTTQCAHHTVSSDTRRCSLTPRTDSIDVWLKTIGLSAYVDNFHARGLFHMEQLSSDLTLSDLEIMKIGAAHRNEIWRNLLAYKCRNSSTDEAATTSRDHPLVSHCSQLSVTESQASTASISSSASYTSAFNPGLYEFIKCSLKVKVCSEGADTKGNVKSHAGRQEMKTKDKKGA